MMGNLLFDMLYAVIIVGGFCLLLVFSERLLNWAYARFPAFAKMLDNFCGSSLSDEEPTC